MKIQLQLPLLAAGAALLLLYCAKEPPITDDSDETVARGSIAGRVTDKQGPIAGVSVSTTSDTAGYSTVTDTEGKFNLPDVLEGTYTLLFHKYGYLDISENVELSRGQEFSFENDIQMTSAFCTVKGTVVDALGNGLRGVGVAIPNQPVNTITDGTGKFSLLNVMPDAEVIIAALGGTGWGEKSLDLNPGDVVEDLVIEMQFEGGSITGVVLDAGGQAAAGVEVSAMGGGIVDTTDEDGSYRLENVPTNTPVSLKSSANTNASGLIVDENSQLDGVDLEPQESVESSDIVVTNGTYIVPDTGAVVLTADVKIKGGGDVSGNIAAFLWDLDSDGEYETMTSTASIILQEAVNGQYIPYGVVTQAGDTITGAQIWIQRVTSVPEVVVGENVNIAPKEEARLLGEAICRTGGIISYQWDFNGDGIYDWKRNDVGIVSYRYFREGNYRAYFLVIASSGEEASGFIEIIVAGQDSALPPDEVVGPEILNPQADETVTKTFEVIWANVSSDSYSVYMDTIAPPESLLVSGLTDTSYTVTGLSSQVHYYFRVEAYKNDNAAGGFSLHVSTGPNSVPVFNNAAFLPLMNDTVRGDSAQLSWDAADPDMEDIHYNVYFGLASPPGEYILGITDTTIKVFPKLPDIWVDGEPYYWEIEVSDGIDSVKSGEMIFIYRIQ
jgi:hypothetical protein